MGRWPRQWAWTEYRFMAVAQAWYQWSARMSAFMCKLLALFKPIWFTLQFNLGTDVCWKSITILWWATLLSIKLHGSIFQGASNCDLWMSRTNNMGKFSGPRIHLILFLFKITCLRLIWSLYCFGRSINVSIIKYSSTKICTICLLVIRQYSVKYY